MKDCLPCKCGSERIICDIYMEDGPTLIKMRCVDCDRSSDKFTNTKDAIQNWNKKNSNFEE